MVLHQYLMRLWSQILIPLLHLLPVKLPVQRCFRSSSQFTPEVLLNLIWELGRELYASLTHYSYMSIPSAVPCTSAITLNAALRFVSPLKTLVHSHPLSPHHHLHHYLQKPREKERRYSKPKWFSPTWWIRTKFLREIRIISSLVLLSQRTILQ